MESKDNDLEVLPWINVLTQSSKHNLFIFDLLTRAADQIKGPDGHTPLN